MLYVTCTMISSIDLAHYRVSRAKDWVSVDCGTGNDCNPGPRSVPTSYLLTIGRTFGA